MPRHTHLLRRGSQYYVNIRVPQNLRNVLKKDIVRRSLHTSDPREAVRRVRIESLKIHAEFEELRAKSRPEKQARDLSAISERDAYNIAIGYFGQLEKSAKIFPWWREHLDLLRVLNDLDAVLDVRRDGVSVAGTQLVS